MNNPLRYFVCFVCFVVTCLGQTPIADLVVGRTVKLGTLPAGTITPSQITANQNDYAPTGYATAFAFRISSDAARTITGLVPPTTPGGALISLENVGAFTITLADESASSTAANRFDLSGGDFLLTAGSATLFKYDSTASRWRLIGSQAAGLGAGYQTADADLTSFATVTPSANGLSLVSAANYAAIRALLDLEAGTDFNAYDADLAYLAGFTPTANVKSILNAADYAAIRALLDLEAGTDFNAYDLALANLAAGSNYVQFTGPTTGPRVFTLPDFNDTILSAAAVNALAPTARTSGVASYFTLTIPADTGITAATESIGLNLATATRTWATTGTVALQRERFFAGPTYASASASQTFTDAFNLYLTPPVAGTNAIFTRGHTLGIVDSTSASSSITGGFVIATTLGTTATSVGIGGGNINAGGSITAATLVGSTSITGGAISGTTGTFSAQFLNSYARAKPSIVSTTGTNDVTLSLTNAGGRLDLGRENNSGTEFGLPAYSSVLYSAGAYDLYLGVNGVPTAVKITTTGINSTVIGATTAAAGSFTTLGASGQITHTMASPRISTVDTASANKTWDIYNNAGNLKFVEIGVADRFTLVAGIGATITGSLTTSAPSGGSAGAWKLGTYTAGAPTADGYVKIDIGGAVYHVAVDAQ